MIDVLVDLANEASRSNWVYVALFGFAAIDVLFPLVPSESLVITAGVLAASGEPDLLPVIGTSALGAFAGDHASYLVGRTAGSRLLKRARSGTRRRTALDWADKALADRGGLVLVVARYVPGGRTAATLTVGAIGYPPRLFSLFDSIAALSWGTYGALVGYLGGRAFEDDPIKGLLLGFALATAIAVAVEIVRRLRGRRSDSLRQR